MPTFETFTVEVLGLDPSLPFNTSDQGSGQIGAKIRQDMNLVSGQSLVWYGKMASTQSGHEGTPIVTIVKRGHTCFAACLPNEAQHVNLGEARHRFQNDFVVHFLKPLADTDGKAQVSNEVVTLMDDLMDKLEARQAFYARRERPKLLSRYGVAGREAELLNAVDRIRMWQFLAEVDLAAAEGHYRDEANYVLFEPDTKYHLPRPAWLSAARPYLNRFHANYGHFTTDARIYDRVLVVAQKPLSPMMRRAVVYLKHQGVNARPLAVRNARDLRAKLDALIRSGKPLPKDRGPDEPDWPDARPRAHAGKRRKT